MANVEIHDRRRNENGVDDDDDEPFLTDKDEEGWLGILLDLLIPVFVAGVVIIAIYRVIWAAFDFYALYLWYRYAGDYEGKKCPVNLAQWVGVAGVVGFMADFWIIWLYAARACSCTGRCCGSRNCNESCRTEIGVTIIISVLLYVVFQLGWLIFGAQSIYPLTRTDIDGGGPILTVQCGRGLYTFAFWYETISWISTPVVLLVIALLHRYAPPSIRSSFRPRDRNTLTFTENRA